MKFKNKLKTPTLLLVVGIISQAGIAFSSWAIINNGESIKSSMDANTGNVQIGINGVELVTTTNLSIGRYFYYVNGESVASADVSYSFSITPSLLPKGLVSDNGSGGFSFELIGDLYLDSISIFDEGDKYLTSVKLNDSEISTLGYNGKELSFDLNFSTATQGEVAETFILSFTFDNTLILDYRNEILSEPFKLEITR